MDAVHEAVYAFAGTMGVHAGSNEIRPAGHQRVVFFRAVKRTERQVLPQVPANDQRWFDRFDLVVDIVFHFMTAGDPQIVPRQQLGIFEQQPPERDEVSVPGTLVGPAIADVRLQFTKPAPRTVGVDPQTFGLCHAELAEAGDLPRISLSAVML